MTTEALISTIIAVVSLLVSVGTAVLTQRMKHRTDLAMAEGNARRDYEYEARKRLYSEFEPLQFRMVELCEAAYERAALSVESVQTGRLAARYSEDWLTDPYAMLSTVYELTAPLVLFQIGRTRLTLSDLNLDEDIKRQYLLSKELYLVWRSGTELAESSPAVSYDDTFYSDRQVPLPRYLDELLTSLLADGDTARLMDFREYYKLGAAGEITELEHLTRPFTNFHPSTKPVLWRAMIATAFICRAIIDYPSHGSTSNPANSIPDGEQSRFLWREENQQRANPAEDDDVLAARNYLRKRFKSW